MDLIVSSGAGVDNVYGTDMSDFDILQLVTQIFQEMFACHRSRAFHIRFS